jgi:hypothetical protein
MQVNAFFTISTGWEVLTGLCRVNKGAIFIAIKAIWEMLAPHLFLFTCLIYFHLLIRFRSYLIEFNFLFFVDFLLGIVLSTLGGSEPHHSFLPFLTCT